MKEKEGGREGGREGRREGGLTYRLLVDVLDAQAEVAENKGQNDEVEENEHPPADLHHVFALAPDGGSDQPEGDDADLREGGRGGGKEEGKGR